MRGVFRLGLLMTASLFALEQAQAGGLVNSSQSTVFMGMAFAGAAAPGSSSPATMFYNPATMTSFGRPTIDLNLTYGSPDTKISGSYSGGALSAVANRQASSSNIGRDYVVPTFYMVYPINSQVFVGVSVNTPYGNSTKPDQLWRGSYLAATSKLRVETVTPSIAYKINDMFSIGAGLQVQYASARQYAVLPPPVYPAGSYAGVMKADGFSVGWTLGVTFTPTKTTQIGLGWRSSTDQDIEGTTVFGEARSETSKGTLKLPNRVNLSLRQGITEQLDVLASVEWQGFGRTKNAPLTNSANPQRLSFIPFGYDDGWVLSLGSEYKFNNQLTWRVGAAYEFTPIKTDVRRLSLPDNDRLWLNTGFTYQMNDQIALNASYAYLQIKNAKISQTGTGVGTFDGTSKAHANFLSLGLTARWGEPPARESKVVVRK